jgi:hypothetical protein
LGACFLNELAATARRLLSARSAMRCKVIICVAKRGIGCQALFLG